MLTVAVTGPTGEIGKAFISALERAPEVERVIGMARRPFDLGAQGWEKTEYRRGDILDRAAVDALVADADAVVVRYPPGEETWQRLLDAHRSLHPDTTMILESLGGRTVPVGVADLSSRLGAPPRR